MENSDFNPTESLDVINKMINNAKNKLADDGLLLIFWGWLVTVAALTHYVTLKLNINHGEYVWAILMPFGGIFSAIYGRKQNKKKAVKTYVDSYLSYVWGAFGIAMVITLVCGPHYGIKPAYFCLMILYGFVTFVSGGLLGFKPLIYGSLVSFACAVIGVYLNEVDQLLIISVALIASYIIPGHLLRSKFKSEQHV